MAKRYDFHMHSLLTEGELVSSEIAQRCSVLDYGGIAITDHVDQSNLEHVLNCLVPACKELRESFDMVILAGVELTHVPPAKLEKMVSAARLLGAEVVLIHGESVAEPVRKGTNKTALGIPDLDILAHPGLITEDEVLLAQKNDTFLEITSRQGNSLTNGHVAKVAGEFGADLLLNSDAHSPSDFLTDSQAMNIALGAGLSEAEAKKVLQDNPRKLLKRI
jgi:histidinol phosphatase-like PHP family hydrolase